MLALFAAQTLACGPAEPPPTRETVELNGSAYDRGFQHGTQLKSKVRSFYTRLLASSILPNLNREQPDLAAVFTEYQKDRYADGRFSFELLLDSAKSLEHSIPRAWRDEMHGIADGAGVPYEQVLVTNTFLDSLLAIRAVAATAKISNAPRLERVQLLGDLLTDGVDNDGDGAIDNAEEAEFAYVASSHATRVELPGGTRFHFTLMDKDGVDPSTIRIHFAGKVYAEGDSALALTVRDGDASRLDVLFTPPSLPIGTFTLVLQAGDTKISESPPPAHAHFMRDERLTFTRAGTNLALNEVMNTGGEASTEKPPAFAFGAAGPDGSPLLAQHLQLLDGNVAHEHTALFVHHTDTGKSFAVVGWAGLIWGMSGMNADGLAVSCNPADTLDNSVVNNLFGQVADLSSARLYASGQPIGIFERAVLEGDTTSAEAVERAKNTNHTFGWSCLFADETELRGIEIDSDFDKNGGAFELPTASTQVIGSHFQANTQDMNSFEIAGQRIQPESGWSSFFFRSLTATERVRKALPSNLTVDDAISVLQTPALVDRTDSMNAVIFDPRSRTLWTAMGKEPATDAEFVPFHFAGGAP